MLGSEEAVQMALCSGALSTQSIGNASVAATHLQGYWEFVVNGPGGDYVIDVSDSVLAQKEIMRSELARVL
jgi:hypothetical protein